MKTFIIILIGVLVFFIVLGFVSRYIIYLLKFKREKLKARFPKYKWHIERLHEIYSKKEQRTKGVPLMRNPPPPPIKK